MYHSDGRASGPVTEALTELNTAMKRITGALLFVALSATAYAYDAQTLTSGLLRLQSEIEAQIERIERAREIADARVSLATVRVDEQLRIAEEDLERQLAVMDRYREQLEESVAAAIGVEPSPAVSPADSLQRALAEIRAQVAKTNELIHRMRSIRNALEHGGPASQSCPRFRDTDNQPAPTIGLGRTFGLGYDSGAAFPSLDDVEKRLRGMSDSQDSTPAEPPDETNAGPCGESSSTRPKLRRACDG